MCNAVQQIGQEYAALLSPPNPKKTQKGKFVDEPFVFELTLEIPRCENKTKFSKWIPKKKVASPQADHDLRSYKFLVHAIVDAVRCSRKARPTSPSKYLFGWGANIKSSALLIGSKCIGPAIVEIKCLQTVKLAVPITTIALKAKESY